MAVDVADIARDLAGLQKNRGLQSAELASRVGPALATVTGFSAARGSDARASLVRQLLFAAEGLPPDLYLVFARACATRPDDAATLGRRLEMAGRHLRRSGAVARRRLADANLLVAAALVNSLGEDKGWFLHSLRSTVDFRTASPVYRAQYTLTVTAPALTRVSEKISLPGSGGDVDPLFSVAGQARLESVHRIHPQTWECWMVLDRTYHCGELIRYQSAVRLPDRRDAPPMSVMAPRRDCRSFATTVHLGGLAEKVWVLDGVTPPTVNDVTPSGSLIDPEVEPEPSVQFRNLVPGLIYGLRWMWKSPPA